MCDQRKNSQPVTCPLRSRSHWLNFAGDSANCPATEKSWRTAAALTVRSPTRRSVFYGRPVFVPEGWKTGCLSGGPQVFRLSLSVKGGREMATTLTHPKIDVKSLDPYAFMAVLGKRVIHHDVRRPPARRKRIGPGVPAGWDGACHRVFLASAPDRRSA